MRWAIWGFVLPLLWGQGWPEGLVRLDSLLRHYLAWEREGGDQANLPPPTPTPLTPEEYEERLQALQTTIPLEVNPVTIRFIELYLIEQPALTARLLGLADYYLPTIESILRAYGLPPEFKYLPVIESALVPEALSPMAAAGIWQFIPSTARRYGLRVDRLVDERYDLVKSTHAAARYLRDSYQILGDWLLVIAAYNCGVGRVVRAIKMARGRKNYWEIAPFLPPETRGYVPAFVAACYVMNYASAHGIYPVYPDIPRETDTVYFPLRTRLSLVARWAQVPLSWLRFHNPALRSDIIPAGYTLRVPAVAAYEVALVRTKLVQGELMTQSVSQPLVRRQGSYVWHVVKAGENLYNIARTYRISPYQLVRWNQLWGYRVSPGMRLKIWLQPEPDPEVWEEWNGYMEAASSWPQGYVLPVPCIIPRIAYPKLEIDYSRITGAPLLLVEPLHATPKRRRR
ncbi:MAG: transglycosylase SLT domain-containing protein [Bacteroidia bacterium]|nr:transglycosylase SLT domain-containing protein [Bacteroidia bacterium]MDW8089319.1 transglycosylase SLT domain-containing protein [Bacteroidia bacterium]